MSIRSIRRAAFCLATTAALVGGLAGPALARIPDAASATSASATVASVPPPAQWTVYRNPLYSHPWTAGGGRCIAESTVVYDPSTNNMHVMSRAKSTGPLRGCRAKGTFTMQISRWDPVTGQVFSFNRVHPYDIPTACSTTDPTCPEEVRDHFTFTLGAGETLSNLTAFALAKR